MISEYDGKVLEDLFRRIDNYVLFERIRLESIYQTNDAWVEVWEHVKSIARDIAESNLRIAFKYADSYDRLESWYFELLLRYGARQRPLLAIWHEPGTDAPVRVQNRAKEFEWVRNQWIAYQEVKDSEPFPIWVSRQDVGLNSKDIALCQLWSSNLGGEPTHFIPGQAARNLSERTAFIAPYSKIYGIVQLTKGGTKAKFDTEFEGQRSRSRAATKNGQIVLRYTESTLGSKFDVDGIRLADDLLQLQQIRAANWYSRPALLMPRQEHRLSKPSSAAQKAAIELIAQMPSFHDSYLRRLRDLPARQMVLEEAEPTFWQSMWVELRIMMSERAQYSVNAVLRRCSIVTEWNYAFRLLADVAQDRPGGLIIIEPNESMRQIIERLKRDSDTTHELLARYAENTARELPFWIWLRTSFPSLTAKNIAYQIFSSNLGTHLWPEITPVVLVPQYPRKGMYLDFLCVSPSCGMELVIECDGREHHGGTSATDEANDIQRDLTLAIDGYQSLRYPYKEIVYAYSNFGENLFRGSSFDGLSNFWWDIAKVQGEYLINH